MVGYNCGFPSFGLSYPIGCGTNNNSYGTSGGYGGIFMIIIIIFILLAIFIPVMIRKPISERC